MGPCPICGEPVALYNSKVIGLKRNIGGDEDFGKRIQSLARVIMEYINSQSGHVDENGIERILREAEDQASETGAPPSGGSACHVLPSIRNPLAAPITTEEAEDFLRIDLNLLAKREYFDRFFG
ncbi:MAG: hypothetical protein HY801_16165 [Candidatus Lindowbacteria bacterium]|nr:hypothetical protein [Candidatus Lindowbacteria bacterium]